MCPNEDEGDIMSPTSSLGDITNSFYSATEIENIMKFGIILMQSIGNQYRKFK